MSCAGLLIAGALALGGGPLVSEVQAAKPNVYLSAEEIAEIQQGSGCKNLVRQFFALQRRMGEGDLETDFYDLKILPSEEMVGGRKGRYYAVYLKDATKRARFAFPGGRYVIDDFETRFRQSLTRFVREILATIEGGAEYEIYVRGSGSATAMRSQPTLLETANYTTVQFLPRIDEQTYAGDDVRAREIPNAYSNDDLPYLRAAFLQDTVRKFYPLKQPAVLQSDVSESREASEQFAELILFVDW